MRATLQNFQLRFPVTLAILCAIFLAALSVPAAYASNADSSLLQADHAAFASRHSLPSLNNEMLEKDFTWTDSFGNTRNKAEVLDALRSKKNFSAESGAITANVYGQVGIVQQSSEKLFVLRVWIERDARWHLLIYHAVSIGDPPSAASDHESCDNPCNNVPFHPQNADQADVIHAYQAVERSVTAHDSAAWGSHIADEFFAVTSNSNRPVDKKTRMAGLDSQKVGGIAPFPLVSARMFEFGDTMIMTSHQQPLHGMPLHVTRVWLKRNGAWLEAYSYQTTIQPTSSR